MKPVTFSGEGFSEYFCTQLLWSDPQLKPFLDADGAEASFKKASAAVRSAQRQLRDREQARSTFQLLLQPLAALLGWRLGERSRVATDEAEEEGGVPLLRSDDGPPVARVVFLPPGQPFDAAPPGLHRRFAPALSLARVLREEGLTYGVVLNAVGLRLICVSGSLPSSIDFDLIAIAEGTYPGLDAWKLLHVLLCRAALAADALVLDRVREVGKQHQRKVSNELGQQVQRAVFGFMQGAIDHPANAGAVPCPMTPEFLGRLYQETLHLLYRLLFVLYAEDLALLPVDMLTYREGYSLGQVVRLARDGGADGLVAHDRHGSFLEGSLRALFDLLRQGVKLGPEGEIKPYGGGLFDPAGTATIDRLAWGNATVAEVLEALTVVPAPRGQVGKVKLSYRELNVEQLGSIYEGLLELAPSYAGERLWEVELDTRLVHLTDGQRATIKAVRGEVDLTGAGAAGEMAEDETDIAEDEAAETDATEDEDTEDEDAGDGGEDEADIEAEAEEKPKRRTSAKKPLKVLREIKAGEVYPLGGQKRKQSGSYYTNRTFVEFLVREALDPKAEGTPPKKILNLRVVDPAMGSGHFLVGACRRLAEHLLAAYRREVSRARNEAAGADPEPTDDDLLVQAGVPDELRLIWSQHDDERLLGVCRLLIAGHCIYGVDKNPLAVDLAKASLWLITAASGLPLTFLDHRLRHGDSLLGIPAEEVVRPWTDRAIIDAIFAALFLLTPAEYAYILSTFPLLDRDQPPLPGDYRVRPTNKGIDRRKQSFVTRDLALLTYFDYLAGRLELKPDPARVSRICPGGVPEPPADVVACFAEAGVDIAGATDRAVAETGPIRGLRARVALARELGAVAYVPTIDRRRASFVERAAEAGGLDPADGVLTSEMARRVLRDKAERDARWQRAMDLWERTTPAEVANGAPTSLLPHDRGRIVGLIG